MCVLRACVNARLEALRTLTFLKSIQKLSVEKPKETFRSSCRYVDVEIKKKERKEIHSTFAGKFVSIETEISWEYFLTISEDSLGDVKTMELLPIELYRKAPRCLYEIGKHENEERYTC